MSSREVHGPRTAGRYARAAALVRALTGVVDARIDADAGGIRTIAVTAVPDASAWEITRNVQSALLASLGLAIDRSVVRVCHAGENRAEPGPHPPPPVAAPRPESNGYADAPMVAAWPPAAAAAPLPVSANGSVSKPPVNGALRPNGKGPSNGDSHSNGGSTANGSSPAKVNGNGVSNGSRATNGNGVTNGMHGIRGASGSQAAGDVAAGPVRLPPVAAEPPAGFAGTASIARVEMETRRDARLSCRVVVALPDRIAAGESDGEDTPSGRLEAAARAVIAAAPAVGAEFDGVRAVDVAGRSYVLAAVRRWSGRELIYRAAVAPQDASPEAAAARATLDALLS